MEISKDYLDKQFKANFEDMKKYFDQKLDQKLDEKLDAKLGEQTKELKAYVHESFEVQQVYTDHKFNELKGYVHESFETQQVYMDQRFDELIGKTKIKERLDQHENWIDKIANKAGVDLK